MKSLAFLAAATIALNASRARAADLHLICDGAGVDSRLTVGTAEAYLSNGEYASANTYHRKSDSFDDEMEIEITGDVGRARLPRRIVPKIHGGQNGWFDIKELAQTDTEITGKVAMNFTNAPRMRISRVSGAISIDGRDGSFAGRCRAYDPAATQRVF
jgi:hypothetical protein